MDVGLSPIVFILMVSTTAVQSQIRKGPMNALKKVGDGVTLKCVTSSNNCEGVGWTKMEGAQSPKTVYTGGIILNGFPGERYSVSSTGGCSLTITQLKISDSGRFSCVLITVDGREETRGSVLAVINVTASCRSNVTSNALSQYDGYSFRTAINVPAKSVEPSDVILSFQKEAADETNTTDKSQPLIVRATLTGKAGKANIMPRVCTASLPPNTAANFDRTTATLNVCTTQQLIVSHPVENITVSPSSGPYYKGATVRCTADGHPYPTFKWTHLKSRAVVDNDTLLINGDVGDKYNCTATNTVKGKTTSLNITITVTVVAAPEPDPGCGPVCIGIIVGGVVAVIVGMVALLVCFYVPGCPLFKLLNSSTDKKNDKRTNGIEEDPEKSQINRDNLQAPQYDHFTELLPHDTEVENTH